MPHHCRASNMFVLLCAFSLCVECVSGGTSFLSPPQKPPKGRGERRPPRVGIRDADEPEIPVLREDDQLVMSAPFDLTMSLSESEYEKYGPVLQSILVDLLGHSTLE